MGGGEGKANKRIIYNSQNFVLSSRVRLFGIVSLFFLYRIETNPFTQIASEREVGDTCPCLSHPDCAVTMEKPSAQGCLRHSSPSSPILASTLQQLPGASPEPLGAQSLLPEATVCHPLLGVGGSGRHSMPGFGGSNRSNEQLLPWSV